MDKRELRQKIKEKRDSLSHDYMDRANAGILTRLLSYPVFQQVESIFCYVSTEQEPSTREIISTALQMGKTVAVPRCIPGSHEMEAVIIQSLEDLEPGTMGILEPKQGLPLIDGYKLDLAIIPCVSADRKGGRLGHGAGYYDRFLEGLGIYKYCLCFEELMSDEIPMDSKDIVMDRVFTEDRAYNPRMASEDVVGQIKRESEGMGIFQTLKNLFRKS